MVEVKAEEIKKYLEELYREKITLIEISRVGGEGKVKLEEGEIKGYGYGEPLLIRFSVKGQVKKLVLTTVRPGGFGHEHFSDRAQMLLWAHSAYNSLPRHVRSLDVGCFNTDSTLTSLGKMEEAFLLTEYVEGEEYYRDLERIKRERRIMELDLDRAKALARYIADVHSVKGREKNLYVRRLRELLGHGEAIMGLLDSYRPDPSYVTTDELVKIEKKCVDWRWRLKGKKHRLSRVHGDFHPWNVKFKGELDFVVLDRSRGEWGEPADDVTAMSINYLFYSIQEFGELRGPFKALWTIFIETYLEETGDSEVLRVMQPFYAWRGLVIANPIWYPTLKPSVRRKIFNFIFNVLGEEEFNYKEVNNYLK